VPGEAATRTEPDLRYWRRLAGRAASVYERSAAGTRPAEAWIEGGTRPEERVRLWREHAAAQDVGRFTRRLSWDGFDEKELELLLADFELPTGTPLPSWVRWFQLFLAELRAPAGADRGPRGRGDGPGDEVQFRELLIGAVDAAARVLRSRTGAAHARLSESAASDLCRPLLRLLSRLSAPALEFEFSIFKATLQTSIHSIVRQQTGGRSQHAYEQFIGFFRENRALDFFMEHAALARLIGQVIEFWLDAKTQFVRRLDADYGALESTFGAGAPLGRLTELRDERSDRHCMGRTVMLCRFESGVRVVYKPKSLAVEECFHALLDSLNTLLGRPWYRVLKHVTGADHGWVEFVAYRPCPDREAARAYHERAGALLCVLFALEAADCHFENVVADGAYPVLVDVETILQPRRNDERFGDVPSARVVAMERLRNSVLATGLLPSWLLGPNGETFDLSGFGCVEEHALGSAYPVWENANTDEMARRFIAARVRPHTNVPRLGDEVLRPVDHLDEIVRGFRAVYLGMLDARAQILAAGAPVWKLRTARIRIVLRSTRVYTGLLRISVERVFVRSGIERSVVLDRMSRFYVDIAGAPPSDWPVFRDEFESLLRLDVPYFSVRAGDADLVLGGGARLEGFFARSGFDAAIEKLQSLSLSDLQLQEALIRSAFVLKEKTDLHVAERETHAPRALGAAPRLGAAEYLEIAEEIAAEIDDRAIRADDGSRTWICANLMTHAPHYTLKPVDETLFAGSAGIALFFAALHAAGGDAHWRQLAYSALSTLRRHLPVGRAGNGLERVNLGVGVGLGSIIYGLAAAGAWLDDPQLLEEAALVAQEVTAERIAADGAFDVVYGCAGTILGLCRLHATSPSAKVREAARRCGDHLLARRSDAGGGVRSWARPDQVHVSGFSHGRRASRTLSAGSTSWSPNPPTGLRPRRPSRSSAGCVTRRPGPGPPPPARTAGSSAGAEAVRASASGASASWPTSTAPGCSSTSTRAWARRCATASPGSTTCAAAISAGWSSCTPPASGCIARTAPTARTTGPRASFTARGPARASESPPGCRRP
jgi:type 2 lantibiotic biosynthesis protein LanM